MYYSPKTSLYSVLNQLIVCTGYAIFFGFVYMKTNIWAVAMIHYLNNNISAVISGSTGGNIILNGRLVLVNLICFTIVYVPFLFTKEYRKQEDSVVNCNIN